MAATWSPACATCLQTAGLDIRDLHVVAVGIGPGSFTGLRIGLTAAKTLAYATSADLVGFDSLEGLAANAPADALCVHVVADAQRGDVYAADFARHAPGEPLFRVCESRIESLAGWSSRLGGTGRGARTGARFALDPRGDSRRHGHRPIPSATGPAPTSSSSSPAGSGRAASATTCTRWSPVTCAAAPPRRNGPRPQSVTAQRNRSPAGCSRRVCRRV